MLSLFNQTTRLICQASFELMGMRPGAYWLSWLASFSVLAVVPAVVVVGAWLLCDHIFIHIGAICYTPLLANNIRYIERWSL